MKKIISMLLITVLWGISTNEANALSPNHRSRRKNTACDCAYTKRVRQLRRGKVLNEPLRKKTLPKTRTWTQGDQLNALFLLRLISDLRVQAQQNCNEIFKLLKELKESQQRQEEMLAIIERNCMPLVGEVVPAANQSTMITETEIVVGGWENS